MGFTEAELGFCLAALFASLAVARMGEDAARDAALATTETDRQVLLAEYGHYRDSMGVVLARLEERLAAAEKRSTKVPQCWEKGEQREPVAVLAVLGQDTFLLGDERLNLTGVRERLADRLAKSAALGCRFVVRAPPAGDVSGPEHSAAVWALRAFFDVDDRPS
jgi:hypothetical protein